MLALAGVGAEVAAVATLAYRLLSFWLPLPAGGVAALLHRRRYGSSSPPKGSSAAVSAGTPSGSTSTHSTA